MTQKTSIFTQRLSALREEMKKEGIDGYIVPRTDEYQGEYVPPCAERLAWLTGFTGSAGCAVVLPDKAVVMSDGRYTIQLQQQVDNTLYDLEDSTKTPVELWLQSHAAARAVIGYDPRLFTPAQIEKMNSGGGSNPFTLRALPGNLIDRIWENRPKPPMGAVRVFPHAIAGRTLKEKIDLIAAEIAGKGAFACVITLSDSIAWLLNIRGSDVPHIPVALSALTIDRDGHVQWFVQGAKLNDAVHRHLGNHVQVRDPDTLEESLAMLTSLALGQGVMVDPKRTAQWYFDVLQKAGANILPEKDPVIAIRARKTPQEQSAMKAAHVRDGLAVSRFLKWMQEEGGKGAHTELSVDAKLDSFRKMAPEFIEPSFDTIAGFNANGAIVHYRASADTSLTITGDGLLLVDSGAQYSDGTTDITRTLTIGTPTQEMRERYTLVLKGHIAVATARFTPGTTGKEIDALARAPMRERGLDYAHGTGHGVGCNLSVHEEAASLSPKSDAAPEEGMILSNEPGYYKQGHYGIRIENLIVVRQENGMLFFETITLAPLDKALIVKDILTRDEALWVDSYHKRVEEALSPLMTEEEAAWLHTACAPL